ncbi:unnamed protein product, partial [Closterium sp. Yama58-4]
MLPGCLSVYFLSRFVEGVGQNDFFSFNTQWFTEFGPQIPSDEKASTFSQAVVGAVAAAPAYALLYSFAHAQNVSSLAFSEGAEGDEEESKKLGKGVAVGGVAGGLGEGGGAGIASGDSLVVLRAKVHSLPWSALLLFGWAVTNLAFLYCRTHDGRDLGWLVLTELICRSVSLGFGGDFFPFAIMNMEYLQENGILRPPIVNIVALTATIMLPGHYYSAVTFIAIYSIGVKGVVVGLMAVAVPTFLSAFSLLPLWDSLQRDQGLGAAVAGAGLAGAGVEIAVLLHLLLQVATTTGPLAVGILTASLVAAFQTPAPIAVATGSAFGLILYL